MDQVTNACAFAAAAEIAETYLNKHVTVVQAKKQLVPGYSDRVSRQILNILKGLKVEVRNIKTASVLNVGMLQCPPCLHMTQVCMYLSLSSFMRSSIAHTTHPLTFTHPLARSLAHFHTRSIPHSLPPSLTHSPTH